MSESNIAYMFVDLKRTKNPATFLMWQLTELAKNKPKAWFCDIVHGTLQMPEALKMQEMIQKELEGRYPWQTFGDNITIRLNLDYMQQRRAYDEMAQIINSHRKIGYSKNVVFKDADGKELPTEF